MATATHNTPDNAEQLRNEITSALEGNHSQERAEMIHHGLTTAWGMPTTLIGENGRTGVPTSTVKRKHADETIVEERFNDRNFFLRAVAAGPRYTQDDSVSIRAIDDAVERGVLDEGIVGAATPIEVDPRIVDVQRSAAPVLDVIQTQAQAGFTAQFNVIKNRQDPVGFLSEGEAVDLSNETPQDISLPTETKDMKIQVGLISVSDFSQRAEESLDYMDLRQTTIGQATIAHMLQKARAIFYGDPSQSAGDKSINDGDSYEGLAKIASDAGNAIDKSGTSSGLLEDLLDEATTQTTNTGLTYDNARYLVSPQFFNTVYDEVTPVVRIDGYDADVEYGPQGLAISTDQGTIPLTVCPNIRDYSADFSSGPAASSSKGDVFLIDETATQFRQLAPMSTVPLARVGLSDRAALFEYGTLIDKSQGEHLLHLQDYAI